MPFYIRTKDGDLLLVESHVGEGLARIELRQVETREEPEMEPGSSDE